jgi:hypothetical protein
MQNVDISQMFLSLHSVAKQYKMWTFLKCSEVVTWLLGNTVVTVCTTGALVE